MISGNETRAARDGMIRPALNKMAYNESIIGAGVRSDWQYAAGEAGAAAITGGGALGEKRGKNKVERESHGKPPRARQFFTSFSSARKCPGNGIYGKERLLRPSDPAMH